MYILAQYYDMKQALFLSLTACILMTGCTGSSPFTGQHGNTEKNGAGKDSAFFIVAEWNVQALFDGHETGNEYAEYREISDWTEEKFMARITAISRAIQQMAAEESSPAKTDVKPAAPDLIGLVEVENSGILGKLAHATISEYGYFWTAFSGLPLSSLGVGFLSRHPLKEVRSHSITIDGNTAPRPVLEIKVEKLGQPLVFLLCHWKSKLGDEGATEALRRASARVVRRRLRELNESEPQTPVIVMGDLNENHDEFSRNSGTPKNFYFALLPDTDDAAALVLNSQSAGKAAAYKDFLVLSGEKPPRALSFPMDIPALYSPG